MEEEHDVERVTVDSQGTHAVTWLVSFAKRNSLRVIEAR